MTGPLASAASGLCAENPYGVPAEVSGVRAEYEALTHGALVIDRSARGRMSLAGPHAAGVLTGLVTNDIEALAPGFGAYAAALTPKGKIIADVRVLHCGAHLLVDVPPLATAGWWQMVRKFVNPRTAAYGDLGASMSLVGVFGPRSAQVVARATGLDAPTMDQLPAYAHLGGTEGSGIARVMRSAEAAGDGFELFVQADAAAQLTASLVAAGAAPGGQMAWDAVRIEAGRPEWGIDMDDTTIPQEANLDAFHAISYTKGCYTGQETVARVHFRGHVNRHLRGLQLANDVPAPRGTPVRSAAGVLVGDVRSAAVSPRLGPIAMAMLRREVSPGDRVWIESTGGDVDAVVSTLPFPASA